MSSSTPPPPDPAPGPPPAPAVAGEIFGEQLGPAGRFVAILADTGVSHGLIGPREVPRLWERHVLGCAVVAEAMPREGASVIDVGSGAGLPGIALAIARPDLQVTLVEPMLRRTTWLTESVAALGLSNVTVCRGRAEEFHGQLVADYVTARAVAALDKLAAWCAPLIAVGGELVVMKGDKASEELTAAAPVMARLGLETGTILTVGATLPQPTTLVVARKVRDGAPGGTSRRSGKGSRPARHRT
ncbi:MAG: 16S rRNA (guanine(527)-N(7))-methyltransferase RsmG [Actinobacteria bacterium]|nr:16S rRNA (guanine(527)-N(7))-methyltransferase RsmG [Actinomycetota bacterium]